MPIPVTCECGRQVRAPDHLEGKKVKCPDCGSPLLVEASVGGNRATSTKAAPPAVSGLVRFACDCGKAMQAKAEYAGRLARCPECGENVAIPGEERSRVRVDKPLPVARRVAPPPQDDFEDEPEQERPRKRKVEVDDNVDDEPARPRKKKAKKKAKKGYGGMVLWLSLAGVMLLALAGGGAVLAWTLLRGPQMDEFTFIPNSGDLLFSVRFAEVATNANLKQVVDQLPRAPGKGTGNLEETMQKEAGVGIADLERVTYVVPSTTQFQTYWAVFAFSKPYDKEKVIKSITGGSTETAYENRKYHASSNKQECIYFVNNLVFVQAPEAGIKAAIDLAVGTKKPGGGLEPAIAQIKAKRQFVVYAAPSAESIERGKKDTPPFMKAYPTLNEMTTFAIYGDVSDSLDFELVGGFASDEKAGLAKKEAEKGLLAVKAFLTTVGLMGGGGKEQQDLIGKFNTLMGQLKFEQAGSNLNAKLKIQPALLSSIATVAAKSMGGGMMGNAGAVPGGRQGMPGGGAPPGMMPGGGAGPGGRMAPGGRPPALPPAGGKRGGGGGGGA